MRNNEESEKENNRIIISLGNTKNGLYSGKLILGYSIGKGMLQFGGEYTNIRRKDLYQNNESIIDDAVIKTNEQKHEQKQSANILKWRIFTIHTYSIPQVPVPDSH